MTLEMERHLLRGHELRAAGPAAQQVSEGGAGFRSSRGSSVWTTGRAPVRVSIQPRSETKGKSRRLHFGGPSGPWRSPYSHLPTLAPSFLENWPGSGKRLLDAPAPHPSSQDWDLVFLQVWLTRGTGSPRIFRKPTRGQWRSLLVTRFDVKHSYCRCCGAGWRSKLEHLNLRNSWSASGFFYYFLAFIERLYFPLSTFKEYLKDGA